MAREMQRERAMVREEIEGTTARARVPSDQRAVLALIEERACFLSRPRRRQVLQTVLDNLHNLGHLAEGQQNLGRQALVAPYPSIVAEQDTLGSERRRYSGEHVRARGLDRKSTRLNSSHVKISYA